MSKVALSLVTLLLALGLQGCIIFPVPGPRTDSGAAPRQVTPHITTRAKLLKKAGGPDVRTPDERFYLYLNTGNRDWAICGVLFFPQLEGGCGGGTNRWARWVFVEFDDKGVVKKEIIKNCEKEVCNACSHAMLFAILEERYSPALAAEYQQALERADLPYGLHQALGRGDMATVKTLLAKGADANAKVCDHLPLHVAIDQGNLAAVTLLVEAGADPKVWDAEGRIALHLAVSQRDTVLVERLLAAGADVNAWNANSGTALQIAVTQSDTVLIDQLLAAGADADDPCADGHTALHLAVSQRDTVLVERLLEAGADANTPCVKGHTALHLAVLQGNTVLVERLLEAGADVDIQDAGGNTPLHQAVMKDDRVMVELLLTHGADVNRQDASTGLTPLHWAAANNTTVVVERLAADADVDIQDADENTPLDLATGQAALIIGSSTPLAQSPDETSAYRVAIFPFGGPENCHGYSRPLNKKIASEVRELIKQNASLSVRYSYYDGTMNEPSIQKPDKLWSGDEPNVNLAYTLGAERGVDAVVMHWRPSWGWGMGGYCTNRMPPYFIKVYLIDVKQRKTYQLKGQEENRRALTTQALNTFIAARSAHGRP